MRPTLPACNKLHNLSRQPFCVVVACACLRGCLCACWVVERIQWSALCVLSCVLERKVVRVCVRCRCVCVLTQVDGRSKEEKKSCCSVMMYRCTNSLIQWDQGNHRKMDNFCKSAFQVRMPCGFPPSNLPTHSAISRLTRELTENLHGKLCISINSI